MISPRHVLAERTVPRYTSYPTAPHFNAAIGPDAYTSWLAALPHTASLSLYLHVPYCAEMCRYCGCHTKVVRRREPVDAYAQRLAAEIALIGAIIPGRRVTHIHWGGGTPSMLGPEWLVELTAVLARHFDLSSLKEHAIELDPRRVDEDLVRALAAIGINRASLGVQEFSASVQEEIGRIQPFSLVERTVGMLRDAGIANINIDLMYGLPRQTVHDVERTVMLAHSLDPARLALFGYAHVPWFKTHQRLIDAATLPGASERLAQAEAAQKTLVSLGYVPIGLDHFARPDDNLARATQSGNLHRNFQGYTTDDADALIGLGASAIGRTPQGYVQNAPDIGGYARAVDEDRLATVKGIEFTPDDRVRGCIIERLMCDFRVDLDRIAADHRFEAEIETLRPLAAEGLVNITGRVIAIPDHARPFARLIASAFDAYVAQAKARHSVAV